MRNQTFTCPWCGKPFVLSGGILSSVLYRRKSGKAKGEVCCCASCTRQYQWRFISGRPGGSCNRPRNDITKRELIEACKTSTSYRETSIKLGLIHTCGHYARRIRQLLDEHNIDYSHFTGPRHCKQRKARSVEERIQQLLVDGKKSTSHTIRLLLLAAKIFKHKCCKCGKTKWLGKPIPLELHHKDGQKYNNVLSNLELLCPNCHVFTTNYKAKK